jgi:glycosyltransferase involved in cell wall biosynthesis
LIAAGVMDPNEIDYFNTFKTKANSTLTSLVGEVDKDVRMNYLQNARLMLMPIMGEEAFGLMFIEAMASGTPNVSFARGSTLEIIKDGITGFLVNPSNSDIRGNFIIKTPGIEGIIEAVQRLYSLSNEEFHTMSQACRKEVENRFTLTKMVNDYEKLYQKLLTQ